MPSVARTFMTPPRHRPIALAGAAVLITGALAAAWLWQPSAVESGSRGAMLIAPTVRGVDDCIAAPEGATAAQAVPARGCTGENGSAAALVESTLQRLQPTPPKAGVGFPLGYTLTVPLLRLFRAKGNDWEVDQQRVQRVVRTVRDNGRPLILYLSSSYFAQQAPIEQALLHDPQNLAQTRDGPLPVDAYRGETLYPWTLARTDTPITARRVQAAQAVLAALCELPRKDRAKIQGIALLGEIHQLAPHFENGMGFALPYRVTDYSAASVSGFRRYLEQQFGAVERLNATLATNYRSLDEIQPPSRDIRSERLTHYTEHMDSYAHGILPISGWVWVPGRSDLWMQVYRDGGLIGRVKVNQGRQDVLKARPELGSADVGWRLDMDFRELSPGLHRITAMLELAPGRLVPLGEREITIMDKHQRTPQPQPQSRQPLPTPVTAPEGMQGYLDMPLQQSFYYNPLAPYWLAYRRNQVADYLQFFDRMVQGPCLEDTPRYTHQLLPDASPGWDANKFAVVNSLRTQGRLRLGVDLHGNASYDPDRAKWLGTAGQHEYGITEFIPLRAMDAAELKSVLRRHAMRGARYVSFYLEPREEGQTPSRAPYAFSLDPQNPQFGSAPLYEAMRQVLGGAPAGASGR